MIGKLLSNHLRPSASSSVSIEDLVHLPPQLLSLNPNNNTTPSSTKSLESVSKPPISVIDEADTRNLLYGSTNLRQTPLAHIDPARDIRVAVISDIPFVDYPFFDSFSIAPELATGYHQSQLQQQHPWASDIPSFHALQDRVFGSSQIRYNGPITKLHPFPLAADSTSHKWLVSRLFRLESTCGVVGAGSVGSPGNGADPSSSLSLSTTDNSSPPVDPNPLYPASQVAAQPPPGASASDLDVSGSQAVLGTAPKVANYTCAICVFITSPGTEENEIDGETDTDGKSSCITNYWDELSAALLQLQLVVAAKLAKRLPLRFREFQHDAARYYQCGAVDDQVRHAVDAFKSRFLGAVRTPRVACGQKRWPELRDELRWAARQYGPEFVAKMIATFVKCNKSLVAPNRGPAGQIKARTVVVGDRITTRRLIFLLAALIHDSYSEVYQDSAAPAKLPKSRRTQDLEDDLDDLPPVRQVHSNASATSVLPVQRSGMGGWEIPKAGEAPVAESPGICTMSHVIRPSFKWSSSSASPSSLSTSSGSTAASTSHSAISRLASANGLQHAAVSMFRKATTSFSFSARDLSPSGSGSASSALSAVSASSFTTAATASSFTWHKRQSRANSTVSVASVDDVMFHSPSMDERTEFEYFGSEMAALPVISRASTLPSRKFAAAAAAAAAANGMATLTLNSRSNSIDSRISSHASSVAVSMADPKTITNRTIINSNRQQQPGSISSMSPASFSTSFESVSIPSKSAVCLDVPAIDDEDNELLMAEFDDLLDPFSLSDSLSGTPHHHHSQPQQHYNTALPPLVVTPVAGFVGDFQPDFVLQGCSSSHILESKILTTMQSEGLDNSKAVLVDEDSGQVSVLNGRGNQRHSDVSREDLDKVVRQLREILECVAAGGSGTEKGVEMVRKCYEAKFGLV